MDVAIAFSAVNSVLLLGLLYIYARIAAHSRAANSIGLVVFAVFLLATNVLTVYSYAAMSPFFGSEAVPYLSTISILEFISLAVLLKITI